VSDTELVSVMIGLVIGGAVGVVTGNLCLWWLDAHVPDWASRPFPRTFRPW